MSIEFYGIKDGFSINVYLCRVVTFAIIEIFNNLIFIYYEKHVQKCREDGVVHLPVADVTNRIGQKSKLKLAIAAANKQCPMDMGASGEISSITFDGSDVVYVLLMNESFLNIDALKENPDAMKSAVTVMFGNPQGSIKEMLDLVVGTDSGIKFIYKGKTSGNEVECYLTTQDLKDILNGGSTAESSDKKKLEEQVKMTNVSCPMQVDEATMLNKLTIESDKVLYHYTIDESVVQMSALKENAEQMKANVKNSLNSSDPALRMFLEVCVKCDKGVGYLYKGNKSGETFEISFGVSEIKALL